MGIWKNLFLNACHRILYRTTKQQSHKTTQKQKNLTNQIFTQKKTNQTILKQIQIWQQQPEDIENYKIQSTIIRSKEKFIINQEKPNKYFYQQEKQNNSKNK